jgi:ubiquinone/menaquinone biosynthesis C-methylase UbiE
MGPDTAAAPHATATRVGSADWQPETVAQRHDAVSAYLDTVFALPALRLVAARTLELLALEPGAAVLEVGCGTGVFLPLLARAVGPAGRVVGLDHAPTFVVEARARVAAAGLAVAVEEGDAYHLPFPDASFDAAHCERVLMHLDDPDAALRELRRVVRPGGRIVAVEPDWGGLRLDHPDRAALDLIYARNLRRTRQPDMGLTLRRRFAQAGLTGCVPEPLAAPLTDSATLHLVGLDLRPAAEELVAEGRLDRARAEAALAYLDDASRDGIFYAHLAMFLAAGRAPAS